MILDDFRSGFGQEIYDYNDTKRYYSSIGMDLSVKGQAMAGWGSTAVTRSHIVNEDMELDSNWGAGANRSSAQAHGGTYSMQLDASGEQGQTLQWIAAYQSVEFVFKCWVWSDTASVARIGINDNVATTYSSYHTGGSSWEQLTATRTLDGSAAVLKIRLATSAGSNNNYFDDATITSSALTGITVQCVDFNDELYATWGKTLIKLNSAGDRFYPVETFTATITSLTPFQVSGTDYLLICLGTSTNYQYMTTGESLTESNATVKTYQFATRVYTTADTLYANDGDNTIRSTTNPLNGGVAWSAQTVVAQASDAILSMREKSGALYIKKEDMPYYLDSSGDVQRDLAPELASARASTATKDMYLWKNELFISAGDQALLRIGTANSFINPSKYSTNLSDFVGAVQGIASDEEWLIIAVDNGAKLELLFGRDETIDGTTSWVWHPKHELTLTGCEALFVSAVYKKRLYIASTASGDSLYYLPLPTKYGDITGDAERNFLTDTSCIFPALHGGFKSDQKAYIKAVATLGHSYDANIYFECWYKKLEDSSYTDAGDFKGTATNRIATLYLPVDASSNNPISTMMWFKMVVKTDDTTKTPILLNLDVRGILYPTRKDIIACKVRVAREVVCNDGSVEKNLYTLWKTCVDNMRDATWPITMVDIDGNTKNVKLLPLPRTTRFREIIRREKGRIMESEYNLLLQKVPLS